MNRHVIDTAEETARSRSFLWAIDWPGWCRGGRDRESLPVVLLRYAPRYAIVAAHAGVDFPALDDANVVLKLVESVPGGSGTAFGVPSAIAPLDRLPTTSAEAERVALIVEAAWTVFDAVAQSAPATLRKGPRGGGRDRDKLIAHVVEADHYYGREVGIRGESPAPGDHLAVNAERRAILDVLRQASDGSPLAGRSWTTRYAARRIAWHALDHAWEIEDRTDTG